MYNNYYKKDIIPKNKQNNINKLDKNDIKLKDKSYDNYIYIGYPYKTWAAYNC